VNTLDGFDEDVEVDVNQLSSRAGIGCSCAATATERVDDDAICRVLVDYPESAEACRQLVDRALERGGRDNVTVVVASYTFS